MQGRRLAPIVATYKTSDVVSYDLDDDVKTLPISVHHLSEPKERLLASTNNTVLTKREAAGINQHYIRRTLSNTVI